MSREIKFRQFAKGKMFYWGFNVAGDGSYFTGPVSGSGVIPDVSNQMQFTGLRDANGVEIYEGDIVKDHNGIGKVDYSERFAAFRVNYTDPYCKWFYDYNLKSERDSIVIIGNIYEHPHLLDEAK